MGIEKEIWKHIIGYEGRYEVSSIGRIRSMRRIIVKNGYPCTLSRKILMLKITPHGYVRVCLARDGEAKTFFVHRLVSIAFIDNPDGKPQVNHINSIRSDNRVINLEWVTSSENVRHKFASGYRLKRGSENAKSRSVYQYDKNGNLIRTFGSIREAERESKIFRAAIRKCSDGAYKHAGGFVWKIN